MKCNVCGAALTDSNFCNNCGADVKIYKKLISTSNALYNRGLEKAQVRDLSGARDDLKNSLKVYKRNIPARNLLGLVYFEMGDIVAALSEWIVSKNYQPEENVADGYIEAVQKNVSKLDAYNIALKKSTCLLDWQIPFYWDIYRYLVKHSQCNLHVPKHWLMLL